MQDKPTQVHEPSLTLTTERLEGAPKKKSSAGWVWLVILILAGAGGYYAWHSTQGQAAAGGGAARNGAPRRAGGGGAAVPVVVAAVAKQNLPLYLDGLGSVTAYYTVTVKSRVDGQMMEVDFKEGQDVKKDDLLAVIDPRPYQVALDQATAALAKDTAQLKDAKLDENRYDQLVKTGVIPQQQYDTQFALAGQLEGAVAADQANIDSAKLNLVYTRITSPIDGRVGLRLVDPGNIVHAADTNGMLVITQMEPIAVVFTLPEDNLQAVTQKMRQGGQLMVKAMTRDLSADLGNGTLETIDNQIDQTTGTFRAKAIFENKDRALWPNQFVNARLLLDTQPNALVVPAAAIQNGSNGTFVYVVKQDQTVEVRPVTVGVTEGNIASISNGLSAGETVVTDGQDRLQAGVTVDVHTDARGGAAPAARPAGQQPGGAKAANADGGQGGPGPGAKRPNAQGGAGKGNPQRRDRQEFGQGQQNSGEQAGGPKS